MRYFRKISTGEVFAYDETDPMQANLIAAAIAPNWTEVTDSWPPAPIAATLPVQAQTQLDKVTGPKGTIIRCAAAGVAVPETWSEYVAALRAIANGTDIISSTLPTAPSYPAGT